LLYLPDGNLKEVIVSNPRDAEGTSIPLLNETLVPGNLLRARHASPFETAATPAAAAAVPDPAPEPHFGGPSAPAPRSESEGLFFAFDADALVERLRGRCLSWLTGEGRGVIEARCSAAMQEHSHWIVGQVSREIGLALETELKGWVKAAVREELAARAGQSTPPGA
jgi:hypothetical protein